MGTILGPYPDAPATLLRSLEADIYPLEDPDSAVRLSRVNALPIGAEHQHHVHRSPNALRPVP